MIGVVAYLAIVIAIPALMLGHQGEDFPPWWWLRAARARARSQTPVSRPESPPRVSRIPRSAPEASQAPSRPVPSWADTSKEAA